MTVTTLNETRSSWRSVAVVAAAVAAALEATARLTAATEGFGVPAALWAWALASIVVTAGGAWLLHRRDERGVAVVVALALLALPALAGQAPVAASSPWSQRWWLAGAAAVLVAAGAAWAVRDRDRWAGHDARPPVVYVAASAAVLLGSVVPTTSFRAGPGAGDRWWVPALFEQGLDRSTVTLLLATVLVAVLLWLGTRLDRSLAAALVGTLALTGTTAAAGNAAFVAGQPELVVTPVGWLHLAGLVTLLVVAGSWWTDGDEAPPIDPT